MEEIENEIYEIITENLPRLSKIILNGFLDSIIDFVFENLNEYPENYEEVRAKVIEKMTLRMTTVNEENK